MNKLSAGGGADMKAMERERTKVRQKLERASGKEAATRAAALRGNQKYTPEDFPPGQSVLVISMNVRGTVVGKPDSKGNIQVQMGILKSRVPYTDLVPARDEEERRLSASLDERVKDETEAFRTSVRAQDISGAPAKAGGPHSGSGRNAGSGSKSVTLSGTFSCFLTNAASSFTFSGSSGFGSPARSSVSKYPYLPPMLQSLR